MPSTDINSEPILILTRSDVQKIYNLVGLWPWWCEPVAKKIRQFLEETEENVCHRIRQ